MKKSVNVYLKNIIFAAFTIILAAVLIVFDITGLTEVISSTTSQGSSSAITAEPASGQTSSKSLNENAPLHFTTLGTQGGPLVSPSRSQPAYLLRSADQNVLVDAGDGAVDQLSKLKVSLNSIHTIILSHLHIDHTGDMSAVLGYYLQSQNAGKLTIYGPPGTKELVDGLLSALGAQGVAANNANIKVIEIKDGSQFSIGSINVTAALNTHYGFKAGTKNAELYQSLGFRFETTGYSLVYTGDTGPSTNMERLAKNADLLVTEIDDPQKNIEDTKNEVPFFLRPILIPILKKHFDEEHFSAEQVGTLAEHSGAKALVLTHDALRPDDVSNAKNTIALYYSGPVTFAQDLNTF